MRGAARCVSEAYCHAVQNEFKRFKVYETGTIELAIQVTETYRRLRAAGRTIQKRVIGLIVTFCLVEEDALLHNGQGYDPFEEHSV